MLLYGNFRFEFALLGTVFVIQSFSNLECYFRFVTLQDITNKIILKEAFEHTQNPDQSQFTVRNMYNNVTVT